VEDIIAVIDNLIAEHKVVLKDTKSLEDLANDASILAGLEEARGTFVPGRFDQKHSLLRLKESLETIEKGLHEHFNREETGLLSAAEKYGDREIVTALNSLLLEHKDLRNRLSHSREHIAKLINGGMGRHQWEASANDMRAHLSHTRKLLEAHAAIENELFVELRRHLKRARKVRK
jgi:hypothetical protein